MTCAVDECRKEAVKGDLCYTHYLKTIGVNKGHLVNRLYPGLTNRETERRIMQEAEAKGNKAVPAMRRAWF